MSGMDFISVWDSVMGGYLIPFVIVLAVPALYFFSHSLVVRMVLLLRSGIRDLVVPFDRLIEPLRLLVSLVGFALLLALVPVVSQADRFLHHMLSILLIIGAAWFFSRGLGVLESVVLEYSRLRKQTNEAKRKLATHVSLVRKMLNAFIVLFAIGGVLMTFDTVRQVGLSILASAGLLSLMIGFAAQKSLTTLIAGIQIAITQPINIGDEIVVENEVGRVEEITLTYVVVELWDQRRVIMPISWFIDRPFQNWSRTTSDLLGTVVFTVDDSVSPEYLRRELDRIVHNSSLWDNRVARLDVTNINNTLVEMRALLSASSATELWALRCYVREELLKVLKEHKWTAYD